MNILILNWRDPKHPNAGGAEIVTQEYAKVWIKAGHTVTLFSSQFQNAKEEEVVDGVEIIRRGGQIFGVQIQAFLWYIFKSHKKFDCVIDQFHGIPFFTPLYVRTKKIAFIHEVTKNLWKLNPWPKPLNLIPFIIGTVAEPWIFKLFYSRIRFITVSDSTKEDLAKWGITKKNITVIHNGISVPIKKNQVKKEKQKTILFLGALAHDKGVEDALEAFSEIKKKEKGWQFWVAGRGDSRYMMKLKQLVKDLKIDVTFFGFVSENKKFELLSRSHLLINPSVREGWGLVNIEANAMSTPVVAYDVPGCRDSIKNNKTGKLVTINNVKEMADACIDLLSNKNEYNTLSKNAVEWSKQFTWEKATQKSLQLIENLKSK